MKILLEVLPHTSLLKYILINKNSCLIAEKFIAEKFKFQFCPEITFIVSSLVKIGRVCMYGTCNQGKKILQSFIVCIALLLSLLGNVDAGP